MRIQVRYFASVREQIGPGESVVFDEAAAGSVAVPRTVADLREWLAARSPAHAAALAGGRGLRMACDQVLCGPEQLLRDGAEVAFFPPVTGG